MADNKFQTPEAMARCVPMSSLQAVLSGKWKILILWYVAFYQVQRFGELMRRLDGITQSTLTKQLRELEADGFLRRTATSRVYPDRAGTELRTSSGADAALERGASVPAGVCESVPRCPEQSAHRLMLRSWRIFRFSQLTILTILGLTEEEIFGII